LVQVWRLGPTVELADVELAEHEDYCALTFPNPSDYAEGDPL
jgi:hypothetical protein